MLTRRPGARTYSAGMNPRSPFERLDAWVRARHWVTDLVLAGFLALTLGSMSAGLVLTVDAGTLAFPYLALPLLVLLHGALVLRRTAPELSFVAITAALALQVAVWPFPLPSDALFPVSLYAIAAYGRRPWGLAGLAVGLLGALLGTLRFSFAQDMSRDDLVIVALGFGFMVSAVVAAWGLGAFRRVRTQYVEALEERARRAEEDREERVRRAAADERARIAREMHDVVAHTLSVVVVQAQGGAYAARTDPARAAGVLETIATTARTALTDMRGLLGVVRDGAPRDEAPQPGLGDLGQLLEQTRAAGLRVSFADSGTFRPLAPTAGLAVYRVVQESLTNTMKHGGPRASAALRLDWQADGVMITVADDGVGPPAGPDGAGHGLVGMRERFAVFGGHVESGARHGGGFGVRAWLPYERATGRA
jgi:signal transduction histidine kinase